jgi:group I intron endonuclease
MQDIVHSNITQCQFDFDALSIMPAPELAEIGIEITSLPETQGYWWSGLEYKHIPCKPGIYAVINMSNGHFYIGSAVSLYNRRCKHLGDLHKGKHHSKYLQNAYNRYGADAFRFVIIEHVEHVENLIEREQHYIDTLNPEYNINPIAGSRLGAKCSEEHIAKVLAARRGKPGKPHSRESKAKMSASKKGKKREPFSEAWKAKLGEASKGNTYAKGYEHTEKARRKISEAHKGKPKSETHKARVSAAQKGKPKEKLKGNKGRSGQPLLPSSIEKREAAKRAKREADPTYGKKKAEPYSQGMLSASEFAAQIGLSYNYLHNIITRGIGGEMLDITKIPHHTKKMNGKPVMQYFLNREQQRKAEELLRRHAKLR